jgi:hypothetical protein
MNKQFTMNCATSYRYIFQHMTFQWNFIDCKQEIPGLKTICCRTPICRDNRTDLFRSVLEITVKSMSDKQSLQNLVVQIDNLNAKVSGDFLDLSGKGLLLHIILTQYRK